MGSRRTIIGVTGIIGSGKSTLCRYLEKSCGFHWIHGDEIAHSLYSVGNPGYQKIKDYFGKQFVGASGVHRGRLRQFILKTPQKLWILNKLIHPLIFHEVHKKIDQLNRLEKGQTLMPVCFEAIFFEKEDKGKFLDQIIRVEADDSTVLRRIKKRKIAIAEINRLLLFQRKNSPRIGKIINNNGSLKDFYRKIESWYSSIK